MTDDAEQYPDGKLTPNDEGALNLRIGIHRGAVVVHFGKAVTWLGFDPENARTFAVGIMAQADELERRAKAAAEKPPETVLVQYVIYEHPADYPDAFVVREWRIGSGGTITRCKHPHAVVSTLEHARACIPDGMVCLLRSDGDEPQIREVWT